MLDSTGPGSQHVIAAKGSVVLVDPRMNQGGRGERLGATKVEGSVHVPAMRACACICMHMYQKEEHIDISSH